MIENFRATVNACALMFTAAGCASSAPRWVFDSNQGAAAPTHSEAEGPCGGTFAQPKRAYLREDVRAYEHDVTTSFVDVRKMDDAEQFRSISAVRDSRNWLPANTAVDVVRRLELRGTGIDGVACGYVAVRIVDAGGAVPVGTIVAIPAGIMIDAPSGATPTEGVQRRTEKARAAQETRRRAATEMEDAEVRSGRCSDQHVDQLRQRLAILESLIRDERWIIAGQQFFVAKAETTSVTMNAAIPGELHFYSVGFNAPTIAVSDAQGYPVRAHSNYEPMVSAAFRMPMESAMVRANIGDDIKIDLGGRGCALLLVLRRI